MTIRVGLEIPAPGSTEPFGAWVLDLLGCFAQGGDEASALAAVPDAMHRYVGFAEPLGVAVPSGPVVVAERFAMFWDGDYEVSPTFADDLGPVGEAEVAFALAMLRATRPALLLAAHRAGAGKEGDRSVEQILHHVAGAESFYVSRLEADPARLLRFARRELSDGRERLAAAREWALERLAALPRLGALERTHRGERWTPRKVLRRFIYHELDHIRELEARVPMGVP